MITDEETVLLCAIRYSCGRRTYVPGIVIRYAEPKLNEISTNALVIIDRDLSKSRSLSNGMGDDLIDRPLWIEFHNKVRKELTNRGYKTEDIR